MTRRWPGSLLGQGRLDLLQHRSGYLDVRYLSDADADHDACAQRGAALIDVVRARGGACVTLRESDCLKSGGAECRYVLTWLPGRWEAMRAGAVAFLAGSGLLLPLSPAGPALAIVAGIAAATGGLVWMQGVRAGKRAHATAQAALALLLERTSVAPEPAAPSTVPAASGRLLERLGEAWRVSFEGTTVVLRHSRGLALLSHLLDNPGRDIHVRDLDAMTPSGGSAVARETPAPQGLVSPVLGDAGELLDAQARDEYRTRLGELREELEAADAQNDLGQAQRLRAEIDMLADELRAAVGTRGTTRRASADIERLRTAITRRIRAAITQIDKHHPTLGSHLIATVSTGYECSYRPDRVVPVVRHD